MGTEARLEGAFQLEVGAKLIQTEAAQDMNCTCWGTKRVCVQGFGSNTCLKAKKKRQIWQSVQHSGLEVRWPTLRKVCDKLIQLIGIVNVWLKVFWIFMSTCFSVSGDVYNFESG